MFFYDKTLADINVSTTERFTLQGQSFTKEKGRWLSDSGESSDAFNGKVSALFTSLSMAKADAVKPYDAQVVTPLGEPLFYLSVLMKDDKGVETSTDLKVWRDPSNSESFYVVNQQKAETMFMVSKSIITEFEGVVANFPSKSAAESKPQGSSNESTAVKNTQG